jgi:hypothetical protein
MNYEKYEFSTDFQDALLACIIAHPDKFMHNAGTLNSAYFSSLPRIATARAIFAYWRKNTMFPTPEIMEQVVYDAVTRSVERDKDSNAESKEVDNISAYVKRLFTIDTRVADVISAKVVEFARERALFIAIQKSLEFHAAKKTPPGGWTALFEEALKIGVNLQDLGYLIKTGDDSDIDDIIDKVGQRDYGTPTGYADLDRLWPFGWGPGWLISILAPPKRYKTMFVINLAMRMIENTNSPVFYYPCEISQELAAIRCLCNLTGLNNEAVHLHKESFREQAKAKANEILLSPLLIKGFPSRTATISGDIRAHAMTARSQLKLNPKAIIIDFAETVKPSSDRKTTSEFRAQGEIYLEARALGAEFNCPVILPDRCNKETVGRAVPSMKSFQGSFEKAGIVDVAIGLCASDQEFQENIIRYFVFLNRHGICNQHFRGHVEPELMRMTIDEKIHWNPEDEDEHQGLDRYQRKSRRAPDGVLDE